ncbi:hypothetical protein JCM5296_007209 [Sporobolomyces johnsonii]
MLDRLPNELILHILELSAPSTYFSRTYFSRQMNLCNCCLVSRQFRQLAQPLLFAAFEATTSEKLHSFLNATKAIGLGHHVQAVALLYTVGVRGKTGTAPNDLVRLAQDCPALEQLSLPCAGQFDMKRLEVFKHLRSLTLNDAELFTTSPFVLPLLAELSICSVSAHRNELTSIFTPSTLPSLRALAFFGADHDDGTVFSEPIETLCSQLHMLSRDVQDYEFHPHSTLASSCPFTLLDCDLADFTKNWDEIKLIPHLRLYGHDPTIGAAYTQRHLTDVTNQLLNTTQTSLRAIYLSPRLHPDSSLPSPVAQARDNFLAACVTRGIEVCWEEVGDWELDSAISPSFWSKAKAIKASASG